MKSWKKGICITLAAFFCSTASLTQAAVLDERQAVMSEHQLAAAERMALLWMRTSAEYRALCYQGYNAALMEVDRALADPARRSKPLAIVLDCDETVTDNTAAMALSAAEGNGAYTGLWWREAVHAGISSAMPGAVEFLHQVDQRGVTIFYVTNRYSAANYDATIENLKKLNFPSVDREHLLMMEDVKKSDKQPRFDKVAADYDVVVYMGDNAGDLPLGTKGKDLDTRKAIIDAAGKDFGTRYIVFPNPAYGAWVSALSKEYLKMTPVERLEFYNKVLTKGIDSETKQKYYREKM